MTPIAIPAFESATLGMLVFLIGAWITRRVRILRDFNIPEPVTGGVLAALVALVVAQVLGRTLEFDLSIRDYLLVLFFSGIGLNARLKDILTGGKPLAILLVLTVVMIFAQNLLGIATALTFGLPRQLGILLGSASLIGGHGTAIAWTPEIQRLTGFAGAPELGIASATLGLVIAALLGGPVATLLIERKALTPRDADAAATVGMRFADEKTTTILAPDMMRTLLVLHVVILIGIVLNDAIAAAGLKLPLFVPCMLTAILLGNLIRSFAPDLPRVSHSPALGLVSDVALGMFLAMSLMSMQLWTLQDTGLVLLVSLALQTLLALAFVLILVFRLMAAEYRAAVLSAGFIGFALGATPTAIANMNAVTKRYGPAPIAFVILPLVSAFFVDIANAVIIQLYLAV